MKLGILNAIPPAAGVVNWNGTPVDAYIRFFERVRPSFEYAAYALTEGHFPDSPGECDAYVITGSPRGAYDDDEWIAALIQFIGEAYRQGRKLVGICFGHQVLAQALGGHVEKSEKGWGFGLKRFHIFKRKAWMDDGPDHCDLYFAHQDQVLRPPPEAELLGGNDFCPIALYTLNDRVLGIQGHPEFTASIMQDLLPLMKEGMEAEGYETAVRSLQNGTAPEGQRVAQWIVNFLCESGGRR